ncbi:MAG TPA: asparagine synthase (glutamine-hydrolyzing), partial [Candidatus Krumholzibacteria bacterium]|nr:asparagine synthase (glutamine-hydrolyzing) [Candidatus Krumholzibacteria bacterium]
GMCGIAGIIDLTGSHPHDARRLDTNVDALAARGPDDRGTSVRGSVGIGMRRLSIIDVAGGHQPICDERETVEVVANGEIYNYVELRQELIALGHHFRTATDTEVLVHGYRAWGLDGLLPRLEGMFAFALHDIPAATVHLVRDRPGIKPLVYAEHAGALYFASTISALLADGHLPLAPDPLGVRLYLQHQFTPGPATVIAGVRKLPPGHVVTIANGQVAEPRAYWTLPDCRDDRRGNGAWRSALLDLTEDAVVKHMRADVPVGVLLSGGLDSSIVLGLMAAHSDGPIPAFTVGVTGTGFDETPFARLAATRFGATLHPLACTPASFAAAAHDVIAQLTEPVGDPACVPLSLVSRLAREHVKVVLSGEGADELFSGYGYYRRLASARARLLNRCKRVVTHGNRSAGSGYEYVMPGARAAALTPGFDAHADGARATRQLEARWLGNGGGDAINRAARIDIHGFLADDLLPKVDGTTMAHGLEARVPFLDHRMLEAAMTIPGAMKRTGNVGKLIVRDTFRDLLGNDLADRSKHGFSLPIATWFREPLRPLLDEMTSTGLDATPWLDRAAVTRMAEEHIAGADHGRTLWTLYTLVTWFGAVRTGTR